MDITFDALRNRLMQALYEATRVTTGGVKGGSGVFSLEGSEIPTSPAAPGSSLFAPYASMTQLSPIFEQSLNTLQEFFSDPKSGSKLIPAVMQLIEKAPGLTNGIVEMLKVCKEQRASPDTMGRALHFIDDLFTASNGGGVANDVKDPFAAKQAQLGQWIQRISALVSNQSQIPQVSRASAADIISFFAQALKDSPATFEAELFSMPILQQAGIKIPEYQAIVAQVEPTRVALLIIAAKKAGSDANLAGELIEAVAQERPILPIIERWEGRLAPGQLENLQQSPQGGRLLNLGKGFAEVALGSRSAIVAQALSPKQGVLPDTAWSVTLNEQDISIQGSLLALSMIPVGLHRIKFKVEDDDGDKAVTEFVLYVVMGLNEEDEGKREREEEQPKRRHGYDNVDIEPSRTAPLAGMIGIDLAAPMILMQGQRSQKPIAAPMQVQFQFLADIVSEGSRYSRSKFLNFAESSEAKEFRSSIKRLARDGIHAVDSYHKALDNLMRGIEDAVPSMQKSLVNAKRYLREEVLMHLMGKRDLAQQAGRYQQSADASPGGDVIASICATTASISASANRVGEAILHFTDATEFAETKPFFMQRLGEFLGSLRTALGAPGRASGSKIERKTRAEWSRDIPILPPHGHVPDPIQESNIELAKRFKNFM